MAQPPPPPPPPMPMPVLPNFRIPPTSSLQSVPLPVSKGPSFNFTGLPSEIRDLIWEATLPPTRIFHVSGTTDLGYLDGPEYVKAKMFKFYVKHSPVIATQVCRESRAVALRHGGFFLMPNPRLPGPWFNYSRDILYFDRNQRHLLRSNQGTAAIYVKGWDKVLNVGLEWRAWFRDIPQTIAGGNMNAHWRSVLRLLYLYMPNLKGIHYVLPRVRHQGAVTWGREPYGSQKYPCEVVPLPEETTIPWHRTHNFRAAINNNGVPSTGVLAPQQPEAPPTPGRSRAPTYLSTWKQIQQDIEQSLRYDDDEEEDTVELDWTLVESQEELQKRNTACRFGAGELPDVVGWWLLRCSAPKEDNPSVKDFIA